MTGHALIAGGGIGGLAAAIALARNGMRATLFEQANAFVETGAGIQLSPNCTRVLAEFGLLPAIEKLSCEPGYSRFKDWRTGRVIAQHILGEATRREYGAPYLHIHRGDLLHVLLEAAQQSSAISLKLSSTLEAMELRAEKVQIQCSGNSAEGDVLIGADGIHSRVRKLLWGDDAARFTGQVAWRALVPAAALPRHLTQPGASVWWGPGAHFVHYPVRAGALVNCVCVVEKDGWSTESWTVRGEKTELAAEFTHWHDDVQTLIQAMDAGTLYKWALHDREPMQHWSKGRVTLLGDACHPTLPFLAQGAAMAVEDAAVLAWMLGSDLQVDDALRHYEQMRKPRTAMVQNGSRRNARVFHLSGIAARLRNHAAAYFGGRMVRNLYGYDVLAELRR